MLHKIKNLILFISLTLIVAACTKYEEGPWISFRSVKNRLEGEWHVVKYTNNGVDSTAIKLADKYFFNKIEFSFKEYSYFIRLSDAAYNNALGSIYKDMSHGRFYELFSSDVYAYKKKSLVSFPPFDTTVNVFKNKWKILKLTKKEMKVRYIDKNDNETNIIIEYEK